MQIATGTNRTILLESWTHRDIFSSPALTTNLLYCNSSTSCSLLQVLLFQEFWWVPAGSYTIPQADVDAKFRIKRHSILLVGV